MKPLRHLILATFFITITSLLLAQTDASIPSLIQPYKTIGARTLSLHIFEPAASGGAPRPCVLLIHGGGWIKGSPKDYYFIARSLRDMGFAVACLQYRLCDAKATPPVTVFDAVADARDALRYLNVNARKLNIDPARMVACGGSAGGHLAAGLALFSDDRPSSGLSIRPAALILFNPVLDTSASGYGRNMIGADWQTISPLHHVRSGLPPTLIFHGTGDRTVPFAGAQAFHNAMLKAGNLSEFHPFAGGDHGHYQQALVFTEVMETVRQFCLKQKLISATDTSSRSPGK